MTYVTPDDSPFLTIHGTKDERVDFKHAQRIDSALRQAGVPSLLIPVTDGGHGIRNWEMYRRVAAFFDHQLRGVPENVSTEPLSKDSPAPVR